MRIVPAIWACCLVSVCMCGPFDFLMSEKCKPVSIARTGKNTAAFGSVQLAGGDWCTLFSAGTRTPHRNALLIVRSSTGGLSWSEPDTIATGLWSARNPFVTQFRDGLIAVIFSMYPKKPAVFSEKNLEAFVIYSYDRGATFTVPRKMAFSDTVRALPAGRIHELSAGNWILTACGEGRPGNGLYAMISENKGETWDAFPIRYSERRPGDGGGRAPLAVFSRDRLLCLFDAGGEEGLFQTLSEDSGKTWSQPAPSRIQGFGCDLFRPLDGSLICVYQDRWPMGISMVASYDEGTTWEQEETLYLSRLKAPPAGWWPSCVLLDEGKWGVCYMEREAEGGGFIRALLFNPDPFTAPRGLSISAVGKPAVSLRWNPVREADFYIVCRDTHRSFIPVLLGGNDVNAVGMTVKSRLVDPGVQPGMTYYYSVIPIRGTGKLVPGAGGIGKASPPIGITTPVQKE
ncbi:exo-alpha-sialidase, partial [bacterium]|nr:exo-alpha-sialidase [bacterium]